MGNSEVGHLSIGSGRIIYQSLTRISRAVKDGGLETNPVLVKAMEEARDTGKKLHLLGLLSDGGVHSHIDHLLGLLAMAKKLGVEKVCIHAFLDGRDTPPQSAGPFLDQVEKACRELGVGQIATVSGRYYAMDRDKRWERIQKVYDCMSGGEAQEAPSAAEGLEAAYAAGQTDEFVVPFRVSGVEGNVEKGDSLAEVVSQAGLHQLHIAETEKYAHVTFFFNGGREQPFPNEDRILVPSPKVATYDLQPEMSAYLVTEKLQEALDKVLYDLVILNFANPDMVGHTGSLEAAVKALETVDECVGSLVEKVLKKGGALCITADHGNLEEMEDPVTHEPMTAHTTNPVPFLVVGAEPGTQVEDGGLSDIAPTLLDLLDLPKPEAMTGHSLLVRK